MNLSNLKIVESVPNLSIPRPWNRCLYFNRCPCRTLAKIEKKIQFPYRTPASRGRPLPYPYKKSFYQREKKEGTNGKIFSKIFKLRYDGTLSKLTKLILVSFCNKYMYYAIDDFLHIKKSKESEHILAFLYSSILSLHNDFSINFFDIWVDTINISNTYKESKILIKNSKARKSITYIQLKVYYIVRSPIKKIEPIW